MATAGMINLDKHCQSVEGCLTSLYIILDKQTIGEVELSEINTIGADNWFQENHGLQKSDL